MKIQNLVGMIVALIALATGTRLAAQDPRTGLLEADRAASRASGDSGWYSMLAGRLDSAGVLLWPGAPVIVGREDVARWSAMLPGRDSIRLTWQPLDLALARDSSLGIVWGVVGLTSRVAFLPAEFGRYMAVWRRDQNRWVLQAILFSGVKPPARTSPPGLPAIRPPFTPSGVEARFVAADLAFSRLAGDSGAAVAFRRWAAPEAIVFGEHGLLTRGPGAIGRGVAGAARWRWHPVAAGASRAGDLGWTVGEAVISPPEGDPIYSKYLTVWVQPSDGPPRFLTDGGNLRPAGAATIPAPRPRGSARKSRR